MKSVRSFIYIAIIFDIIQQIQAELIQPQIHNGYSGIHLFNIHHLILQPFKLFAAVFQISGSILIDGVIIASRCHYRNFHTGFHPVFELNIIIQCHIGPVVDQLDLFIFAADTVNTPETLNQPHRVPVDVVVDQIVAVLQVLTFRNTVGGNQNINIIFVVRVQQMLFFGNGRKERQHGIDVHFQLWHS